MDRNRQTGIGFGHRDNDILARDRLGHQFDHMVWNVDTVQIDKFHPMMLGKCRGHFLRSCIAGFDQRFSKRQTGIGTASHAIRVEDLFLTDHT